MLLDAWLDLSLPIRLTLLCALGLLLGGQVNHLIYRLARDVRPISPWQRGPAGAPRNWLDRVPLLGWWLLRRESSLHGRGFWLRPLVIELLFTTALVLLYWWEAEQLALIPRAFIAAPNLEAMVHTQFGAHALLLFLMFVATFIDFDERLIPDEITVIGMLLGLVLVSIWPQIHLPSAERALDDGLYLTTLKLMPEPWPTWLSAPRGLALAIGMLTLWLWALLDKTATLRRGWRKGWQFLWVSIVRHRSWIILLPMYAAACIYVGIVWWIGGAAWQAELTALTGLCAGGGMIWGVRLAAGSALGIEAMGFGDVTLMAMIGTFLGWQTVFIILILACLVAMVIGIVQWAITGDNRIPFGPYLCLGTAILVVCWNFFWTNWAQPVFDLGSLVPITLVLFLVLTGVVLWIWRWFRENVLGIRY